MRDHIGEGYKSHRIQGEGSFFGFVELGFHKRSVFFHSFGEDLLIRVEDFIFLELSDFKHM